MEQQISSRWTFFYKFVLPVLVTGGMFYGAWRAFTHPDEVHVSNGVRHDQAWIVVLALGVLVGGLIWWTVARLKRVVLDGDELVISNYVAEIRVPLTAIESISGPSATNPKRYTVTFAEPTDFGRTFTFMPPMVWSMNPWAEAEDVRELRDAWTAARDDNTRRRR